MTAAELLDCIREPTDDLRAAVIAFSRAADLILEGELQAARQVIAAIDEAPLRLRWRDKDWLKTKVGYTRFQAGEALLRSKAPSLRERRQLYQADGWHCRYCKVEVIDPEARNRLVELLLPFGSPLWGRPDASRHAALLNLSASYDHVEPNSKSGDGRPENLVTACWFCQFGKMAAPISLLGLSNPHDREPIHDGWDGLTRLLGSRKG